MTATTKLTRDESINATRTSMARTLARFTCGSPCEHGIVRSHCCMCVRRPTLSTILAPLASIERVEQHR